MEPTAEEAQAREAAMEALVVGRAGTDATTWNTKHTCRSSDTIRSVRFQILLSKQNEAWGGQLLRFESHATYVGRI